MKRLISAILVIAVLTAFAIPVAASAETLDLSVSGETEGYKAGDVITVTVTVSDPAAMYYLCVTPSYDKTLFSMTAENGNAFDVMASDVNLTFEGIPSGQRGNAVVSLRFTVLDDAPDGVCSFGLIMREAYDENEASVKVTVSDSVTVRLGVFGDVSGDGECTVADLVQLMKHICGMDSKAVNPDVNGDGKCNLLDIVRLMKILASK